MPGILADANIEGYFQIILRLLQQDYRQEFWESLAFSIPTFEELGLSPDASDWDIWQVCQREGLLLITANRSQKEADSLESAIRLLNKSNSLPVITLSNPKRIRKNRAYAELVADQLLESLFDLEKHLGTGRIYLPRKSTS